MILWPSSVLFCFVGCSPLSWTLFCLVLCRVCVDPNDSFGLCQWLSAGNYPSAAPLASTVEPSDNCIATLVSMGFDRNSARQALVQLYRPEMTSMRLQTFFLKHNLTNANPGQ
ncbi:hypothetical protein IFM89_024647 [Coptis chinensis]|uniref:UBA domain-containing protein n=1 Tax=Coptis chinensis TaxID=261450 RepID=A0A835LJA0_9MAGN|nr:hypothetical protein IFM89_024647 [Coptis chinensis]